VNLKIFFLAVLRKLCSKLNLIMLYESKVGIKYTAPMNIASPFQSLNKSIIRIKPDKIFIGFDALKDPYTLLNRCIKDSPHLELVRLLSEKKEINQCEYIKRLKNGIIDIRIPMKYDKAELNQRFKKRLDTVANQNYEPIIVYQLKDKYYIVDGKHRAALCVLLGHEEINCVEIPSSSIGADRFMWWLYAKMRKNKKVQYTVHDKFFNQLKISMNTKD
jgi:hypothetical protein